MSVNSLVFCNDFGFIYSVNLVFDISDFWSALCHQSVNINAQMEIFWAFPADIVPMSLQPFIRDVGEKPQFVFQRSP